MKIKQILASTSVAASLAALSMMGVPATAASQSIAYYISPPKVEGSYLSVGGDVTTENFDGVSCSTTWAMGTVTPGCTNHTPANYGGAVTETATAVITTGATATNFLTVSNGSPVTLNLTKASKYIGFWWSAGDPNNTIDFYKGSTKLLTITTADILAALSPATITSIGGSNYNTYEYYGNPNVAVATSPSDAANYEPFAYLHLVMTGGASFDKIVMSQAAAGGGFELDNFLSKVSSPSIDNSLVKLGQKPLDNPVQLANTGNEVNVFALGLAAISMLTGAGALALSRRKN
ncbi:MAG: LPXTG cell wall anchor domain-containing protein [Micrococcales bacterium]